MNSLRWQEDLDRAKEKLRQEVHDRRERCLDPSTDEYKVLLAQQVGIEIENQRCCNERIRGRLRPMTPERLFPYERIDKATAKAGVTFTFFAFEIYRNHLFPYARQIAANNPNRPVYIQEDNDPSHLRARRILAPEIQRLQEETGVTFTPHLGRSPDLVAIETLHREENKDLEDYRFNITSADKATRIQARQKMTEWWQGAQGDVATRKYVTMEWYKTMMDRCRAVGGG